MQKAQLQQALQALSILDDDGYYSCDQFHVDLMLKTVGQTWGVNEVKKISMISDDVLLVDTDEAQYCMAISDVLLVKVKKKAKVNKAGFGR